jgi:hypothetical protein
MFVPVVNKENKPLMPTSPSRAKRWIKSGKATPFWKKGIFCIRLNVETEENIQQIALGVDSGSKKHGLTVKSTAHTYLNVQADAVTWVSRKIETRRNMRKDRRSRKTPYRKARFYRKGCTLLASSRARWDCLLRLANHFSKLFPITDLVVENVAAVTKKGQKQWNRLFSYVETGKNYFYNEIKQKWILHKKSGFETSHLRKLSGLSKSKQKLADIFEAHCVDSWVLANWLVGGHSKPDNTQMMCYSPIQFTRRQLHKLQPAKGGVRRREGGTISLGLKKGAIVMHKKHKLTYISGYMKDRISLCCLRTGTRICQNAKVTDIKFLSYNGWRWYTPTTRGL